MTADGGCPTRRKNLTGQARAHLTVAHGAGARARATGPVEQAEERQPRQGHGQPRRSALVIRVGSRRLSGARTARQGHSATRQGRNEAIRARSREKSGATSLEDAVEG